MADERVAELVADELRLVTGALGDQISALEASQGRLADRLREAQDGS
jgi:hypothetical protein